MATQADDEQLTGRERTAAYGYAAWKQAKIERGLAESRYRDAMIPIEQIWRGLQLDS